jgi:hypothetical protein
MEHDHKLEGKNCVAESISHNRSSSKKIFEMISVMTGKVQFLQMVCNKIQEISHANEESLWSYL